MHCARSFRSFALVALHKHTEERARLWHSLTEAADRQKLKQTAVAASAMCSLAACFVYLAHIGRHNRVQSPQQQQRETRLHCGNRPRPPQIAVLDETCLCVCVFFVRLMVLCGEFRDTARVRKTDSGPQHCCGCVVFGGLYTHSDA